jgi:hypothetical protein
MKGILADNNLKGHVRVLLYILESEEWGEVWQSLDSAVTTFQDLGLPDNAADVEIWHKCQEGEIALLTANRNKTGPDSLESAIQKHNLPTSLPVFTIAEPEQVLQSRAYAERVVQRLLEYLVDIDNFRGTGRLFLP